jgi:hypothetical protein
MMYEPARTTWKAITRKMKKPMRGVEAVMTFGMLEGYTKKRVSCLELTAEQIILDVICQAKMRGSQCLVELVELVAVILALEVPLDR